MRATVLFPYDHYHIYLNFIISKLDIRISYFKSSDVEKYPTTLKKITWLIFLINNLFRWTTLRIQHLKIYFFCLVEGWTFSGLNTSFYFDNFMINTCLGVFVLMQSYFICECLIQHHSYLSKQFLLNAWFALIYFFLAWNIETFTSQFFSIWQHFLCALYFILIMLIVYL